MSVALLVLSSWGQDVNVWTTEMVPMRASRQYTQAVVGRDFVETSPFCRQVGTPFAISMNPRSVSLRSHKRCDFSAAVPELAFTEMEGRMHPRQCRFDLGIMIPKHG